MCGIAGYVTVRGTGPADGMLERMTGRIAHRGPDDCRFYHDETAHLGHRRLSIIDVSGGHQPMTNETGDLWIIYNGEIFNHASVRPELERAGHVYRTHCDTETILHGYEEFGAACVERFRGMFSFAIWDRKKKRLFCGRDRLGIKPFYYYWDGANFVFGSEIKAVLAHPAVPVRLEEGLIGEYLAFGYSSEERTLFQGIRKLMPGHTLTLDCSGSEPVIRQYWDVPAPPEERESRDEASWLAECKQRLEETVRMRLMSDVPLGMFLSGGVDSSLIAAMMKRQVSGPVETFAVGYNEAEYSELGYARQVAKRIGTSHHEVVIGKEDFFGALPKLIWHEDEPIAWPSSVSLYFVSKLAARQVKVVLTGEGSDELFAGYNRYRFYLMNQRFLGAWSLLPGGVRKLVREQIQESSLLPAGVRRKLGHTFLVRGSDLESLYLDNFYSGFSAEEQRTLGFGGTGNPYANYRRYWTETRPALNRLLYADLKTYLVELLMKQDQMSMATSIESRVPFLDHPFVEFSTRVPDSLKLRGKTGKYLIKKVAEKYLPLDIIYRPKMGFPTPLRQWLREPSAETWFEKIVNRKSLVSAYLDTERVKGLLDRHRRGHEDATERIWRLLNLAIWGEIFLNGGGGDFCYEDPVGERQLSAPHH